MGSKQSIQIQTPPYNSNEWQYLPDNVQIPEQYGLMRTLQHITTKEKIDQYQFIWPNQDEYLYYLKSFNWRCKEPKIVNTKYLVERNQGEFCSHNYVARVYIEHPKIRLSEISDIPFPDNLYVLIETMDGYKQLYDHSKYFEIQENQICVDQQGNIKIWINGDLSINYPNNSGTLDYLQKGQGDMVDCLINLIADNTDKQTEPRPTFKEYYLSNKEKIKRFEQAKLLVINYARLHNIEIPQRFEAILNMQDSEEQDISNFDQNEQPPNQISNANYMNSGVRIIQPESLQQLMKPNNSPNVPQIQNIKRQGDYFMKGFGQQFNQYNSPGQQFHHHQNINSQMSYPINPVPHQQAPVYYIPHYTRIQYPAKPNNCNSYQSMPVNKPNLLINNEQKAINEQVVNILPINSNIHYFQGKQSTWQIQNGKSEPIKLKSGDLNQEVKQKHVISQNISRQIVAPQNHFESNASGAIKIEQTKQVKYFYTLDKELQIDAEIVADMEKYLC